jgi:hypothetical protein
MQQATGGNIMKRFHHNLRSNPYMSIACLLSATGLTLALISRHGYPLFGGADIIVEMLLMFVIAASLFCFYKWLEIAIRPRSTTTEQPSKADTKQPSSRDN